LGNQAEEKKVFSAFIAEEPMFAGAAVTNWGLPSSDPPDIECDLADGSKAGVELTTWLDEQQMSASKRIEVTERGFRRLLAQEPNTTVNIQCIWMSAKQRLRPNDEQQFRSELLSVIEDIDKRWSVVPEWHLPQGFAFSDFKKYPVVERYLGGLNIYPRETPGVGITVGEWLTFPNEGGFYSPYSMVDALCARVKAKVDHYSAKPTGFATFDLLVHYDKAGAHNSPVKGLNFSYREAVDAGATTIGNRVGVFDRIFVYVPVNQGQKVFRLYPRFR